MGTSSKLSHHQGPRSHIKPLCLEYIASVNESTRFLGANRPCEAVDMIRSSPHQ